MFTFSRRLKEKIANLGLTAKYINAAELSSLRILILAFCTPPLQQYAQFMLSQLDIHRFLFPYNKIEEYPHAASDLETKEMSSQRITVSLMKRENDNANPIARLELKIENNKLEIDICAVDPAHQKQGIGKILIEIAREIAMHNKCITINLSSATTAISFYKKLGFFAPDPTLTADLTLILKNSQPQPGRAYEAEDVLKNSR